MSGAATALLVFARAPRPGRTKTRLIPALGAEGAARLHERMVQHAVGEAVASGLGPVTLLGAPDTAHAFFRALAARHGCALRAQSGGDLGERMHAALRTALSTHRHALLIGSDCPSLVAADLRAAHALLEGGVEVVLGPAADGGYVLIGMRGAHAAPLRAITWGSAVVLTQTRARLRAAGLAWAELAERCDIDQPEDLWMLPGHWPEARAPQSWRRGCRSRARLSVGQRPAGACGPVPVPGG